MDFEVWFYSRWIKFSLNLKPSKILKRYGSGSVQCIIQFFIEWNKTQILVLIDNNENHGEIQTNIRKKDHSNAGESNR